MDDYIELVMAINKFFNDSGMNKHGKWDPIIKETIDKYGLDTTAEQLIVVAVDKILQVLTEMES